MSALRKCPDCGTDIAEGLPDRLCAACTLRGALTLENPVGETSQRIQYFGDYELQKEIARGGMGIVYKARQASLNRTVAVKMILKGHLATEADVRRFRAEGEAAANLQHPNIVAIHEIGEQHGQHYFSMDFVEGPNLAQLASAGPLQPKRAAKCVKALAEAIDYAHQKGILHRDLKPSNILVDRFDQPRITDFGLAKRMDNQSDLTLSGQVLGTPNFMPPEQAASKRGNVGRHSDIYSLGAILYFLLTGKPPFSGETTHETFHRVINEEPVPPRILNSDIPRDLQIICLKCLEKDASRRYASGASLADDLDRFLRDEPIQARPVGQVERIWRSANRHPLVTTLALALLVVFAALIFVISKTKPSSGANELAIQPAARPILPMPTRSGQGVSGMIGGKVYITSPLDGTPGYRQFFNMYDPAANIWKRLADVPTPRTLATAGIIQDKLYVAGGGAHDAPLAVLEVYDPKSNTWTSGASMPAPRAGCASAVLNGKLYVFGGVTKLDPLDTVESYDPRADKWSSEPPLLIARIGCGAATIGDTIYIVSGFTNASGLSGATGLTESWKPSGARAILKTSTPMDRPVGHAFIGVYKDLIYVAGGITSESDVANLQIFSPERLQWLAFASMPEARWGGSGAHAINGEVWIFGGWTSFAVKAALPQADIFAYDPTRNVWRRSIPSSDKE